MNNWELDHTTETSCFVILNDNQATPSTNYHQADAIARKALGPQARLTIKGSDSCHKVIRIYRLTGQTN